MPAGAGRRKGRPKADPEGMRSTLPPTKAAGTLLGGEQTASLQRGRGGRFNDLGPRTPTAAMIAQRPSTTEAQVGMLDRSKKLLAASARESGRLEAIHYLGLLLSHLGLVPLPAAC
jgi:hypothetical protein